MPGAILGLKRKEALRRMPSIEAFADVSDFFHQPLKMYSSGMAARLAFAVCAHADAGILIVDEALSVGDASFGAKCNAYIKDFAKRGTILIVSHDLVTLQTLCDRLVWIEAGAVKKIGTPEAIIPEYNVAMGFGG